MNNPEISVVVCTHNRADGLREALASLSQLATSGRFGFELVVIDNASQDHTQDVIAEAAGRSSVPVRGIYESTQGIVPARNRGIQESRGQWIAFFDDDQLAELDWLLELYQFATERRVRCVGGAVKLKLPEGCHRELAPFCRMLLGESLWSQEPMPYTRRISPGAGNLMLEAGVFRQVGLFQRSIRGRGEDTDLFHRMLEGGIDSWYVPTAVIHHVIPPERLQDAFFLKHARRMGEDIALVDVAEKCWTRYASRAALWAMRGAAWLGPRWMLAKLTGRRELALEHRSRLAMTEGYVLNLVQSLRSGRRDSCGGAAAAISRGTSSMGISKA